MRPLIRTAIRASSAFERNTHKKESEPVRKAQHSSTRNQDGYHIPSSPEDQVMSRNKPKEFETVNSSTPRPLNINDVASAPPELRLKKASKIPNNAKSGPKSVLSLAQKAKMEIERESAIQRYRALKEQKAKTARGLHDPS